MAPTAASAGWRVAYIELRLIRRSQEGGGRGPTPKPHADVLPALAAVARASRPVVVRPSRTADAYRLHSGGRSFTAR